MEQVTIHSISTPRLTLRKIRMSDLHDYFHHLTNDPAVAAHMLWNACDDISHTHRVIQRILDGYEAGSRYHWAIASKQSDSLIGTIALVDLDSSANSCGFAYMLGREFWGQGYATEALNAVVRFAFGELNVSQIAADHFEENPASGIVLQKAGMVKTRLIPGRYEKDGRAINAVQYVLTKRHWEETGGFQP